MDGTARRGRPVSRIVPVLSAAEAVELVPIGRDRVGQLVERPGLPGRRARGPRRAVRRGRRGRRPDAAPSDRGRRHVRHRRDRSPDEPGADQARHRRLVSERAVVGHAAEDRHADRGRRDRGLQHPVGHPVPAASRVGGRAARCPHRGRQGHLHGPAAERRAHERADHRGHRRGRRLRRSRVALPAVHPGRRRDHPGHDRRRVRQSDIARTKAPHSASWIRRSRHTTTAAW